MTVLPWMLVVFICVTTAIAFIEWLVGDEGVQRAKARLADWYVYVEEGDWSRFIASAAQLTEAFLERLLGRRLVSTRSATVWFAISAPLSLTAFVINRTIQDLGVAQSFSGVVGVFILDYACLLMGRTLLRRLAKSVGPRAAVVFLGYAIGVSYMAIGWFLATGSYIRLNNELHFIITGNFSAWAQALFLWPFLVARYLATGSPSGSYSIPGAILILTPSALSTVLLGSVVTSAGIIYVLRARWRRTIALFIERVAGLKSGYLTAASSAVTAIVAISAAVDHARR